jgi:hypothetical protein
MPFAKRTTKQAYQREWLRRRRLEGIERLGGRCIECGGVEGLEFDHIDPATKITHNIWSWATQRRLAEIDKCVLRCTACHIVRSNIQKAGRERASRQRTVEALSLLSCFGGGGN